MRVVRFIAYINIYIYIYIERERERERESILKGVFSIDNRQLEFMMACITLAKNN